MPGRIGKYCIVFEVQRHKIGRFEAVRLVNKQTQEYLEILTTLGAGINDFVVVNEKGKLLSVVDGYRSEKDIDEKHHLRYKGSKLSPFPNRIYNGKYAFDGESYQLDINEVRASNSLHGFLHNKSFQTVAESANNHSANLRLSHVYKGTEKGYPFSYDINLNFELKSDGFKVDTEIINTSHTSIPIGDGWHPYFKFPNINKVELKMDNVNRVTSNRSNVLGVDTQYNELKKIGKNDWDDCYEIIDNDLFSLTMKDKNSKVELSLWQDSQDGGYRYIQLYTPPDRKSIAVEPVTCTPNGFNSGYGLIVLKPNETMSMSFGINNVRQTK